MRQRLSRRSLLKAAVRTSLVGSAVAATGAGYSIYGEPGWLDTTHLDVPLARHDLDVRGITIAHLTDIHLSNVVQPAYVTDAVARTNAQRPDMIVLTGDYVTAGTGHIADAGRLLGELRAPLGVYAVLGNHDHWSGAEKIHAALADNGITVLRNEHRRIDVGGAGLWLIGVDDVWEHKADLAQALHGIPEGEPRIALVHEPDFADIASKYDIDLQLSGHSHGGQVRLPGIGAPVLPRMGQKYPIGLRRVPGSETLVYTSRGIGVVDPPVRFNCRPEIAMITLHSG